ncbi:amino acid ABC transporter ATP-binding protein [Lactobacillus delbrueckii subsp. lactis DSM 20072]|uniref:amino acid ABC transporter ATP-binding protein n=1 Tax=Lactobacillus delbrueckii TaxID=1584 RepID=UPI000202EFEA|nr:amino acid ABC transporter ATP-binding protein [Lactobacillus delbrueckii]ASW11425.1 amino acid ABC transporter ATP-binding protein [Lactobacillus delbrueckii subsp. lactis DSM 20072]EGD26949.1 amino acid ABC superfamily ATP binding cassette transporter, ABC protein [Lactobacillus delbrueckii subsp. lactis DSM 20072]KRK65903.1 amino acid abc superfamily atp binding cassette transporter, abc protein [Lactobacillus delbrueckii subsp. lactis DSM 20072]MCT3501165.1 amino acid ABC transporter ATP
MKITKVSKTFGNHQVLKNISLDFPAGKTTVLVGPSGSGKSTILRSLDLLERPESGNFDLDELHIDFSQKIKDADILTVRKKTGMVFQSYNLFPHFTVLQNVTEGPVQVLGKKKADAEAEAKQLLAKVGLADKADFYPETLSGGQAQRVAIARSLAMHPEYILLDEPTSALDPELEMEVLKVLLELAKEKQSLVIVTHNLAFARRVADKIVFVENGEILYDGDAVKFFAQDNDNQRIRDFLNSMSLASLD